MSISAKKRKEFIEHVQVMGVLTKFFLWCILALVIVL